MCRVVCLSCAAGGTELPRQSAEARQDGGPAAEDGRCQVSHDTNSVSGYVLIISDIDYNLSNCNTLHTLFVGDVVLTFSGQLSSLGLLRAG